DREGERGDPARRCRAPGPPVDRQGALRDPGLGRTADVRPVRGRAAPGRVPPVPREPAAADLRLRGRPAPHAVPAPPPDAPRGPVSAVAPPHAPADTLGAIGPWRSLVSA